jgi:hypothetical protein
VVVVVSLGNEDGAVVAVVGELAAGERGKEREG